MAVLLIMQLLKEEPQRGRGEEDRVAIRTEALRESLRTREDKVTTPRYIRCPCPQNAWWIVHRKKVRSERPKLKCTYIQKQDSKRRARKKSSKSGDRTRARCMEDHESLWPPTYHGPSPTFRKSPNRGGALLHAFAAVTNDSRRVWNFFSLRSGRSSLFPSTLPAVHAFARVCAFGLLGQDCEPAASDPHGAHGHGPPSGRLRRLRVGLQGLGECTPVIFVSPFATRGYICLFALGKSRLLWR